uniref:Oxysterol-binding protein-related protein 1 n=1 Tax=Cacopsylla melanoneura TaxID=428564 RepID=A0A8D8Q1C1_9HEMI
MTERNSGSDSNSSSEEEPTYSLSAELDKLSLKEIHELFLYQCRNGQLEKIKLLLDHCKDKYVEINLSQKGESKSNLGWTPLHLASYFGHKSVVEFLLDQGVDINAVNDAGDTALHKAAFVGREDIVCLLISKNANINIVNGEGRTPRDVCKHNDEARKLLAAAEKTEGLQKEQKLLNAARANDLDSINSLLKEDMPPNINCVDVQGNTALHCAAYRGHKEAAILLLQNGINTSIKNSRGQSALDLAKDEHTKQVLSVQPVKSLQKTVPRFEGRIFRKSKFIGWKSHWAVIEKGVLEYFKNKSDARFGLKRKEFKYLDGAKVLTSHITRAGFNLYFSDGTVHSLSVPLDSKNDVTGEICRQKWVSALKEHIALTSHYLNHRVNYDSDDEDEKAMKPLGSMQDSLCTASAHQKIVESKFKEARDSLKYMNEQSSNSNSDPHISDIVQKLEAVCCSASNMLSSMSHCLTLIQQQEDVRVMLLKQEREREKCRVLEEALNVLAQEHHDLEQSIATHMSRSISMGK